MNKFKLMVLFLCASLIYSTAAFAGEHKGDHKGKKKDTFFKQVILVYTNQDELNISEEQLDKVKALKIAYKKDLIQMEADIDILAIDIQAELWNDTLAIEKINALIDQKYAKKTEKAKAKIKAIADLKEILTANQKEMIKKIMIEEHKKMK